MKLTDKQKREIVENFCLNVGDWSKNGLGVANAIEAAVMAAGEVSHKRIAMIDKPKADTPVLAWDGKRWVRAIWVPRFSRKEKLSHDFVDYNEKDDTFYMPHGWYELHTHSNEILWYLSTGAKHWIPMPPPPTKDQS